jgi:thioredoxin 1/putative thioredoxin
MSQIPMVSEQNFEQEVLRSELPVLVEFGAEWCGPCKTVAPELEALSQELQGKAKILQVDVDKSPRVAQAMRVQSVPTFVVFRAVPPYRQAQVQRKKPHTPPDNIPLNPAPQGPNPQRKWPNLMDKNKKKPFKKQQKKF